MTTLPFLQSETKKSVIQWAIILISIFYLSFHLLKICAFAFDKYWYDFDELQQISHHYLNLYPENFSDKAILNYIDFYTLPLYDLLFSTPGIVIDPHQLASCYAVILVLFFWIYCYKIARLYCGINESLLFLIFISHSLILTQNIIGACARGFASPLFVFFLYHYLKRNRWTVCFTLCSMAFIYPSIFLVSLGTLCLNQFSSLLKPIYNLKKHKWQILIIGFSILFLILKSQNSPYGKIATLEEAQQMRAFYHFSHPMGQGRFDVLPLKDPLTEIYYYLKSGLQSSPPRFYKGWYPFHKTVAYNMHLNDLFFICFFLLFALPVLLQFKKHSIMWAIPIACLILYFLARFFAFKLHYPDRFLMYSFPIYLLLFLPKSLAYWQTKFKSKLIFQLSQLALIIFFFLSYPIFYENPFPRTTASEIELLEKSNDLPSNILITAIPETIMDMFPVISKKESYTTLKSMHPYFRPFYNLMTDRAIEAAQLTFATNKKNVAKLTKETPCSHLLINKTHLLLSQDLTIFQPLKEQMNVLRNHGDLFYFSSPPQECIEFENDKYLLINLSFFK